MSKYLKNGKVILCVILAVLTAIMLPIEVFAQVAPKHNPSAKVKFDSLAESEDVGEIVTELKERRDEYTKHFRMDDGTIMALTYDIPVHYKNKKGEWIDYDNTLISESTASPDEASQISYSNKKSKLDVNLASEADKDNLISISSSKGCISWEYIDAKKSNIKIDKTKKKLTGNDRFTSIDNLSSKASYKSIYDKVNLDCIVSTVGVKENIILQDKSAQNEFNIEYNIKGFTAKQTDKQTVKLYKGKKEVYSITAPCMYDANKKTSTNLSLKIIGNKAGKLSLKLTADKDFLNNAKYPVTIDPEVSLNGFASTETAYVVDSEPNTVKHQSTTFGVGKSGSAYLSGLVKCKNVADTFAEKNIVSAKLNIFPMNYSTEMEIDAHQITSSWANSTATYNNVSYDSEIIDYTSTKNNSESEVTFDITKVFKKWANGTLDNNGVYLKSNSDFTDFGGYCCYFNNRRPSLVIKYKDYTGLESNLTSHSVPCGQDAIFSVCDYTGSLSVKQSFFEENTARLPLSIYATYHSVRNSTNEHTGYGWHYSFNQTLSEDNNYYIYKNADGVNSYFKKEDNQSELSDEDELYILKYDSSNNKIEIDDGDITKSFEIVDNTNIYKIKTEKSNDNSNNKIQYFYNNAGYMNKITTSLGDYRINRTNDHYICNVQTPNNKYMYFVYYGGTSKMARFTAVDGKASMFYYTSYADEGLLREVRYYNESNSGTMGGGAKCEYNSDNKVSSISELGKNGASRKAISVTYNDNNTTEFKELANNNKKETYTFDNYGNTVSVLNANGMITNASDSGSLSVNTGSDSYTKNYLSQHNEPVAIGANGSDYTLETGSAEVVSTESYLGNKSIKLFNNENQTHTLVKQDVSNVSDLLGQYITFSAYVKIDSLQRIDTNEEFGAYLKISAGNESEESFKLNSSSKGYEWERISVTLQTPSSCDISVYLGLINASGEVYFDCLQLEKGKVMNNYNALINSDFIATDKWSHKYKNPHDSMNYTDSVYLSSGKVEIDGNGGEPAPTEETTATEEPTSATEEATSATYTRTETETIANDIVEETNAYGNVVKTEQGFVTRTYERTYEVASSNSSSNPEEPEDEGEKESEETKNCNNYIYQEVDVNKSNVSFVLSGSAKAQSVPLNNEYRTFGIALKIKYDSDNDYSETHYQAFNAYTDSMQNVTLSVTPNYSENTIEKVAFAFVYGYNKNIMTIKNAMLNYEYNGTNKESLTELEMTEPEITEPEITQPETTELETTEPENTEPATYGSENEDILIAEEIQSASINTDEDYMRSQKNYDSNGNYVTSEIDEAGNTITYTNDSDGNVTKIKDGENNETSYSYDVHNNLLSVTHGNSSNTYTYNAYNELSKITHNGFDYNYTYSNFGEPTSVKVGNQAFITYTYDSNGKITTAAYGNGDSLNYFYDDYARITEVKLNNTTTLATYIYNKKNQLTKFVDGKSGETTEYCYDCNGNALYKYLISDDGELLRVVEGDTEKITVNGSIRTITSGTDDNGKSYVKNGKATITTDTDDFGRTTKMTTKVDDSPKFSVNYTYKNVLDSDNNPTHRTTKNIDKMSYKLGNDEPLVNYSYTYDKNGNIKNIRENGISKYVYTYDSLNQLTRVADVSQYYFFDYTYDISGNITEKKSIKSNPSGAHLNTTTTNYLYTNSNWGDLLIKYDGQTLTYDNIGNPLNYRDGMSMSWSGRELQSISKNNNTYSFTYNLDGLRTKKNSNGTNTFYYYDDSNNLIGLKKGSATVLFYYDSEGQLYSMTKGEDTYFFVKNLQGDVTKIIDENGTICATYAYDAWGALLAENENNSIEGLNPFRYRGYVYDTETEMYYLQSRYYDPLTGRFINADDPKCTNNDSDSPLSTNMFSYCENNPLNRKDYDGRASKSLTNKKNNTSNSNTIKYTIKYLPNKGKGYMSDTVAIKGKKTMLKANAFKRTGCKFKGWNAYRTRDKKWWCENKKTKKCCWKSKSQIKGDFKKHLFKDKATVTNLSVNNKDVLKFKAKWKRVKKTLSKKQDISDVLVLNDHGWTGCSVHCQCKENYIIDETNVKFFYRNLYVYAKIYREDNPYSFLCSNISHENSKGKNVNSFEMKKTKYSLFPGDIMYGSERESNRSVKYTKKSGNYGIVRYEFYTDDYECKPVMGSMKYSLNVGDF